ENPDILALVEVIEAHRVVANDVEKKTAVIAQGHRQPELAEVRPLALLPGIRVPEAQRPRQPRGCESPLPVSTKSNPEDNSAPPVALVQFLAGLDGQQPDGAVKPNCPAVFDNRLAILA